MLRKRFFTFFLVLCMICSLPIQSFASSDKVDALEAEFEDFKFTTNDYDPSKVTLEYSKTSEQEQVIVKDKETNEVLEIMEVQKPASARSVTPYIFKRTKDYGVVTVELSVHVELYNEGSFRQINALKGSYLGITNAVTSMEVEDKTISVWSQNDSFPTTTLLYAYSGTLVAEVGISSSSQVSAELLGAGFTYTSQTATKLLYRKAIDSSGTISLY